MVVALILLNVCILIVSVGLYLREENIHILPQDVVEDDGEFNDESK